MSSMGTLAFLLLFGLSTSQAPVRKVPQAMQADVFEMIDMFQSFMNRLELTEGQKAKLRPVLEEKAQEVQKIVESRGPEGSEGMRDFVGQFSRNSQELEARLRETLSPRQMREVEIF